MRYIAPYFLLRLGEPYMGPKGVGCRAEALLREGGRERPVLYVYILQSLTDPDRFYVGITSDLKSRLKEHNSGEVFHTAKYKPWKIKNYFAFEDQMKAHAFERYLKSGSGRAFVKKRF